MEKFFFLLILSLAPSPYVLATTLGEVNAAAGIANTLQGTAQNQPQDALNKVKQVVQEHEQVQQKKDLANTQAINTAQPAVQGNEANLKAPENTPATEQAQPIATEGEAPAYDLAESDSEERQALSDIRDLTKEEFEERL